MDKERLVADTSFYSFFIDDTCEEKLLDKIINTFTVEMPPKVYNELLGSKNPDFLNKNKNKINIHNSGNLKFSEILKPLFSKEQEEKGEHEIIVLGIFCLNLRLKFVLLIDDAGAIKFIQKNLPYLLNYIKRTAGFIGECCTNYAIFNKPETLDLLDKMGNSKFFIDKQVLNAIKNEVKSHHD